MHSVHPETECQTETECITTEGTEMTTAAERVLQAVLNELGLDSSVPRERLLRGVAIPHLLKGGKRMMEPLRFDSYSDNVCFPRRFFSFAQLFPETSCYG